MKSLLKISALTLVIQDTRTKWRPGDILLISGPEVRRKRNWSEIRIFMPAAGSLRSRTPSSTASENYWYVLRKKPITILLLFILLLPLLFGERSFLSIASYLRIGSKIFPKNALCFWQDCEGRGAPGGDAASVPGPFYQWLNPDRPAQSASLPPGASTGPGPWWRRHGATGPAGGGPRPRRGRWRPSGGRGPDSPPCCG